MLAVLISMYVFIFRDIFKKPINSTIINQQKKEIIKQKDNYIKSLTRQEQIIQNEKSKLQ
jgi:hypothetical protein